MAHPSWDDIPDDEFPTYPRLQRDDPPPPKQTATMAPKPSESRPTREKSIRRFPWVMIVAVLTILGYLWLKGLLSF